jgi:hypothetical protein
MIEGGGGGGGGARKPHSPTTKSQKKKASYRALATQLNLRSSPMRRKCPTLDLSRVGPFTLMMCGL